MDLATNIATDAELERFDAASDSFYGYLDDGLSRTSSNLHRLAELYAALADLAPIELPETK